MNKQKILLVFFLLSPRTPAFCSNICLSIYPVLLVFFSRTYLTSLNIFVLRLSYYIPVLSPLTSSSAQLSFQLRLHLFISPYYNSTYLSFVILFWVQRCKWKVLYFSQTQFLIGDRFQSRHTQIESHGVNLLKGGKYKDQNKLNVPHLCWRNLNH